MQVTKKMRDRLRAAIDAVATAPEYEISITGSNKEAGPYSQFIAAKPESMLSLLDHMDALEEKAAALDWLLGQMRTAYGLDMDMDMDMTVRYLLRSRNIDDEITTIGTGPTPLAAVLDAKSKEKTNG